MPWRGWGNAEIYDRFVREHRIYRRLNQELVERADLMRAERVLDLGCGTGATSMACLRVLDMTSEVVGVDASEEMVEVARANVLDPRARFVVSGASSVHRVLEDRFDRVLSNAAFWQFPRPRSVFESLARVTEAGARMVFNVPAERVVGQPASVHPFQVALARAIENESGARFDAVPETLDAEQLRSIAAESGFDSEPPLRFLYRGRQSELMELMGIPAMIDPLTPGFSDERRARVLERARTISDPDEWVEVPWIYFVFERTAAAPLPGSER